MFEWDEDQRAFRDAVRRFVETEIAPRREALDRGDQSPYEILRRFLAVLGIADAALERFEASLNGSTAPATSAAEKIIPMIELSRHAPGLVTAMGVSAGLTAGAILRSGTREQRRRWVPGLLTMETIGAWAITEPDSGSDAFGGMRTKARPVSDGYVVSGTKTFITNGPAADVIVVICKFADGQERDELMTVVLDRGMPGLYQSAPMRKMGLHSSPTGEVVLQDVHVEPERVLRSDGAKRGSRRGARSTFAVERASVAAMALGIIERCLELSVQHARDRVQFGRPIGEYQLIQLKLAKMEIARLNVENLVLRYVGMVDCGHRPTLAEASAMKLYSAQAAVEVALEAVQVFGGNGYMAENPVEQLLRDSKVLQIYGGTDEIQVTHIASDLLDPARSGSA